MRFWKKVKKTKGCWLWSSKAGAHGYGHINGGLDYGGRMIRAHRLSWVLHYGPIPEGKLILHKCDNRKCVRPDHLEAGTQSKNIKDAYDRGRIKAHNLLKTHCPKGHPYDEVNTLINKKGSRYCGVCHREKSLENKRRKKQSDEDFSSTPKGSRVVDEA